MKKPYLPARVRQWCIWIGVFSICLGAHLESDYRERIPHLPSLVDQHGRTASLDVAMTGLDSYAHAKSLRRLGFTCFGFGALLLTCGAFATAKMRGETD